MSWWSRRRSRPGRRRCWPPSANTCPTPRSPTACTSPCAPSRATSRRCCASSGPTTAGRWPTRRGRTPAPAPTGRFTGIPGSRTTFVGRTRDRDLALERLARARLVTLFGPGGVGKTRLAAVVAEAAAPAYPTGGAFVDLVPVRAGFLVPTVAGALGVTDRPPRSLEDGVVERLGAGRSLLVLDNCEHLVDEVGPFVERVLSECPDATILATSRQRLGLTGEHVAPRTAVAAGLRRRAAVRGPGAGRGPRLRGRPVDGDPDLRPVGRDAAGDRAGRRPLGVARHRRAARGAGRAAPPARRRSAGRRAAPLAPRGHRVEPRPARRGRAGAVPAAVGVRGRLRPGRRRRDDTGCDPRRDGRPRRAAGRPEPGRPRRRRRCGPVAAAGPGAGVRPGAARGRGRGGRRTAAAPGVGGGRRGGAGGTRPPAIGEPEFDEVADDLRAALAGTEPVPDATAHRLAGSLAHLTFARGFVRRGPRPLPGGRRPGRRRGGRGPGPARRGGGRRSSSPPGRTRSTCCWTPPSGPGSRVRATRAPPPWPAPSSPRSATTARASGKR